MDKRQTRKRIPGTINRDGIGRTRLGAKLLKGPGWRLVSPNNLEFPATLLESVNDGSVRVAIFTVPKKLGH
ncbi:MAG: hypothetical protein EKK33_23085 [Bradyrhizobiaceae bacterium]|nr:MAG: hypothetical protein EKK33_23085 [Bradyrhizobiaceae bacterium]